MVFKIICVGSIPAILVIDFNSSSITTIKSSTQELHSAKSGFSGSIYSLAYLVLITRYSDYGNASMKQIALHKHYRLTSILAGSGAVATSANFPSKSLSGIIYSPVINAQSRASFKFSKALVTRA